MSQRLEKETKDKLQITKKKVIKKKKLKPGSEETPEEEEEPSEPTKDSLDVISPPSQIQDQDDEVPKDLGKPKTSKAKQGPSEEDDKDAPKKRRPKQGPLLDSNQERVSLKHHALEKKPESESVRICYCKGCCFY